MAPRHAAARSPRSGPVIAPVVAAPLGGLACWAAFPPVNAWPLGIASAAVLALVARGARARTAFLCGWLFGLGFFVPLLSFLRGLGIDAWLVLAVAEALWFGGLALALRVVSRLPAWPVAAALVWVGQEWARDRFPFGGFPWGRLGFAQTHGPLLPLAAIGGAPMLTAVVALLGSTLAWGLVSHRRAGVRLLAPAMVVAGAVGGAVAVPLPTAGEDAGGAAHATVAVVQGNVPRLGLEAFAQRRAVTANHVAETERLAAAVKAGVVPAPDIVVWPENASDDDPFADPIAHAMISRAVAAAGVPVLVGAVLDGPGDHVRNAAVVWSPTSGPGEIYVKRHLVPFGEYLPFRSMLSRLIGRFSLIPHDFAAGTRPGVLQVGPVTVADAICFEVADDEVVRQAVTGGGRLLVVQTNNATYERHGDSGTGGETAQQLEITRLRAVEHGRAAVVAATSGVSAIVAPDGTVLARTGVFTAAHLVAELPLRDTATVSDQLGAWPERIAALLGLFAVVLGTVRRRRSEPLEPPARATSALATAS
jgi:apolipoprotein N-acyltransferase